MNDGASQSAKPLPQAAVFVVNGIVSR